MQMRLINHLPFRHIIWSSKYYKRVNKDRYQEYCSQKYVLSTVLNYHVRNSTLKVKIPLKNANDIKIIGTSRVLNGPCMVD